MALLKKYPVLSRAFIFRQALRGTKALAVGIKMRVEELSEAEICSHGWN
jgi:hypothetical protein